MRRSGTFMLILGWLLIAGLIWWVMDGQLRPNDHLASVTGDRFEVVLERGMDGHYDAPGFINGQPVHFLVDTGATQVAVSADLAARLGLPRGPAGQAQTANGTVTTFATRLETVSLGGLTAHNVAGGILPRMPDDAVLLGMSFLSRFDVTIRGDEMVIRRRDGSSP
jgi:aspartyl protease family protein